MEKINRFGILWTVLFLDVWILPIPYVASMVYSKYSPYSNFEIALLVFLMSYTATLLSFSLIIKTFKKFGFIFYEEYTNLSGDVKHLNSIFVSIVYILFLFLGPYISSPNNYV